MVTWDSGNVGEDSFMAIDQDGEVVELDYSDIIRFHNDDENETKLKNAKRQVDALAESTNSKRDRNHYKMLHKRIQSFIDDPEDFEVIKVPSAPPGSPIGSEFGCTYENSMNNILSN